MYPARRIIHLAVDAFYELIEKNNLAPDDIKEIVCKLHPRALVGNEPKTVQKIVNTPEIATVGGRVYDAYKEYAKGDP
jgi:2-methylcitrate dehydratase PrpD